VSKSFKASDKRQDSYNLKPLLSLDK
jgi:hypothetical protein